MVVQNIAENLAGIKEAIRQACVKSGRDTDTIKLIAVSKNFSGAEIEAAYRAGQRFFGENRVQELNAKIDLLPPEIEWHFIGTLQRNKVKNLIGKTALIHSVDSQALAEEINKQAQKRALLVDVLLQVNIVRETTKHGFEAEKLIEQIEEISKLSGIKIKGLMTIAPLVENPEEARPVFRELRMLAQTIERMKLPTVEMRELSMGMSHDFQVAVEEGATLVRIGSGIFGRRNY